MGTAIWILYGVICLLCVRPLAGHIAWRTAESYHQNKPDGEDWFMAGMGATLLALAWPMFLLFYLGNAVSSKILPAVGAEARAIQRQKDERIKQLERELDLND